jgi:hypothetical protein
MKTSEQINELTAALAKASGEFQEPELDAVNPFFKSRYATLGSVLRAVRPALAKNGLSILQMVEETRLETIIAHSSGQFISSSYPIHATKNDAQGFGAAVSYARRYSIKSLLSLAEEDLDAEDTKEPTKAQYQAPKPTTSKAVLGPSEAQLKRLHAIASNNQWNPIEVKQMIFEKYGIESSKDLNRDQYNELCDYLEKNKPDLGDIK